MSTKQRKSNLVARLTSQRGLWAAWLRVTAGSGFPGVGGIAPERFARRLGGNLTELGRLVGSQGYRPQPRRQLVLDQAAKQRNPAVPTVRDRVVQRAFLEVLGWISAPLVTGNGLVERPAGVPQGAPASPALANHFLANHFLAEFDRAVGRRGRRLVRDADDLAVFCADEDARWEVEQALTRLHLRLNPAMSYASSFDRGFSFLGWIFFRDGGYEEAPPERWVHPMAVGRNPRGRERGPW